jgi:hypothetical protein
MGEGNQKALHGGKLSSTAVDQTHLTLILSQQEHRPSYLILNNPEGDVGTLSDYQIVICTHRYLLQRHAEVHNFATVYCRVHLTSLHQVDWLLKREVSSCALRMPEEWDIYNYSTNKISTLILDDAHLFQRPTQNIYQAVRALPYGSCIMLNTTSSVQSWVEYSAQVTLLPDGGPFTGRHHYQSILSPPYGARPALVVEMPKALESLMEALMITQSDSVLGSESSEPDSCEDGNGVGF